MSYLKKATIGLAVISVLNFTGCGGSSNESTGGGSSEFDTAVQMNLSQLNNYDLITGDGSGATNFRRSKSQNGANTTIDNFSLKLSSILKETVQYSIQNNSESKSQKISAKSVTVDGDIARLEETNNGNISGTKIIKFEMNMATGKLAGSMTYSNYRNSESNLCGGEEIDNLSGTMNVTGIFDTSSFNLKSMTINLNSNFSIDDMTWKSGSSIGITYNNFSSFGDDVLMTMTIVATKGAESIGFKNYKLRGYDAGGYEYSYPIEGNLYIFTGDINGYFSVDTNYDHSLTPTRKDFCGEYTYSGKEKYVGDNSNLTWEITSINNYKIDIDSNNDGVIDISKVGIVGGEF